MVRVLSIFTIFITSCSKNDREPETVYELMEEYNTEAAVVFLVPGRGFIARRKNDLKQQPPMHHSFIIKTIHQFSKERKTKGAHIEQPCRPYLNDKDLLCTSYFNSVKDAEAFYNELGSLGTANTYSNG